MDKTLARTPMDYYPTYKDNDNRFLDDVSDFSASVFKEIGVVCPCNKKTYYNKYTFIHVHCRSNKHLDFLTSLKNKSADILKTSVERKNEIKTLKVMLGKSNQQIIRLSTEIQKLKSMEEENNELKIQLASLEEHLRDINKEYEDFKKETLERNQKIETFSKSILESFGYDIE